MKRLLVTTLALLSIVSPLRLDAASPVDTTTTTKESLAFTIVDDVKYYSSIKKGTNSIELFPESALGKAEALNKFPNAYNFVCEQLSGSNIKCDLDNTEFQQYVKGFYLVELKDSVLQAEVIEFARFMDYYENKEHNEKLISEVNSKSFSMDSMESITPATTKKTEQSTTISKESSMAPATRSSYSGSTAANYAKAWWNKTNNGDYPYYAEYYGQTTSTDNINDLPQGASGQSNPRRDWNDCTNFISQAIKAGGISTIKSGLVNPHRNSSNWYYSDSKPSFTWGAAHNFYLHFKDRAGVATSSSDLTVGDVCSVDFEGDGDIDHTIMITKSLGTTSNKQWVTYHTQDRKEEVTMEFFYGYLPNIKLYGYEMDGI